MSKLIGTIREAIEKGRTQRRDDYIFPSSYAQRRLCTEHGPGGSGGYGDPGSDHKCQFDF